jgi:phosphatidylglycerophosphate synthase
MEQMAVLRGQVEQIMIDGNYKAFTNKIWNALARGFVAVGLSPNQVTMLGLVFVLADCAIYPILRSPLIFGLGLAVSLVFDGIDGAVARLTNSASSFGGYLDAVVDRYQEVAIYFAIAWVTGWWAMSFLALSGSLLTSYNKARTAVEVPINNDAWPDLLERLERLMILTTALIFDPFIPLPGVLGGRLLYAGLVVLAAGTHLTALQRFWRARKLILQRSNNRDTLRKS